jgi:hypothetical protein
LNRPVNIFGTVMEVRIGEIVPTGVIVIAVPAFKEVFRLPDRPDLRTTQQFHQNVIVGHMTPVLPSLWSPTTAFGIHTTADMLNSREATWERPDVALNKC